MAIIDRMLAPGSTFQRRFFFLAKRFIAGETIASALTAVREVNAAGMSATLDFLGEDVLELRGAAHIRDVYLDMLGQIRSAGVNTNVSVKLTAVGLLIGPDVALANLRQILQAAQGNADPFVRVDMEGSPVTQATLDVVERAREEGHKNVGPVLQAMLRRTPADVDRAIELGQRVRLCKGAYNEPAPIAFQSMPEIRAAYLELAKKLLAAGTYPGIATHDRRLIAAVKSFARKNRISSDRFEFQMLYGIRPEVQRNLIAEGWRLRIYIPFGTHWAGYFYRRIVERRENLLFALSSLFSK